MFSWIREFRWWKKKQLQPAPEPLPIRKFPTNVDISEAMGVIATLKWTEYGKKWLEQQPKYEYAIHASNGRMLYWDQIAMKWLYYYPPTTTGVVNYAGVQRQQ